MSFSFAKSASIVSFGLALAGIAQGQTYRQSYPLPDATDLSGLGINLMDANPTDAQFQMIQDAGFKYVRYDMTWAGIEKVKGVFDWAATDGVMAKANAHGLRVQVLLAYGNPLYTSDTGAPSTATSRAAFAAFAASAAARYTHRGIVWELYNEPNITAWWPTPNPVDYAALANATATAIRSVSSDEWIMALNTQAPVDSNTTTFNSSVINGLSLGNLDGLAYHPYTQSNPEIMVSPMANGRAMGDTANPIGHSLAQMIGEVGIPRTWTGSAAMQSVYTLRTVLTNLSQGVGYISLFSFSDISPDTTDWHATCGLTSYGANVPYPVYYAVQRMTSQLSGYKFSKRLTLASANDYCLLFSNPDNANDNKLVVWTSNASHTVTLPSSAAGFASLDLATGATGSATATPAGLAVAATGDATVYACSVANPLLDVAAKWGKLPASLVLSTKADAIDQLGSVIVSPAWATAPVGTTLKIEDVPATVAGYTRPSYTTTLSNLSALTLDSAAVQTVFNSLGALQDEMGNTRSLKLTVQLPDGSSVLQAAAVARKQTMLMYPTTPQNWQLTLRVDNPSGAAFSGSVKAYSGLVNETQPVSFAKGETYQMLFFPALTTALLANNMSFELYDNGVNPVDPGSPVVASTNGMQYRASNSTSDAGYTLTLSSAATGSTATLGYGNSTWAFIYGMAMMNIDYSFSANSGGQFIALNPTTSLNTTLFAKTPYSIGMWVNGDGSGNYLASRFVDDSAQTFQLAGPQVTWTGWRWVIIPIAGNLSNHWSGANDGVVHGNIRCRTPLLISSAGAASGGRLSVAGISVYGQK